MKTRIEEIPTGVDVTFFESGQGQAFRSEHGIPSEALVLGHVGRLAPEKNLAYLGEAAIRGMAGREDVWLLIVGEGPSKTEIEKAVEEQGLSDRLVAPGTLTGRTLSDAYRAMDLFVFSSTSETQGMVLAEAMAAGVPVVALDASGCRDVVEDGVNGRLLPADAPAETFSHETLELLRNAGLMKRFKEKAYRTARSLSRETCAGRLEALYAEILAEASDNSPLYRTSLDPWDALLGGLKAEWELISRKTTAAVKSFQEAEGND